MIDSSLLHELFLQRLPANVQMILASADTMAIGKLADMADRIMEAATSTISSVSRSQEGGDLRRIIHEEVPAAFKERSRPQIFSGGNRGKRNRSNRRSASLGRARQETSDESICCYHQ